ncbi:MAG TPA: GIY-YIG nuclease family protein [Bacteroidia bacterium]|nr:GIY-YIG nuclease family protein [Bacteroidia bacterium]
MSAFCYIIYSSFKDAYYVGSTSDEPSERLRRHNSKHKGYTSSAQDWIFVYLQSFDSISQARSREKQIKRWKSRKAILKLIGEAGSEHPDRA